MFEFQIPRLIRALVITLAGVLVVTCFSAWGSSIYDDQGKLIRASKAVTALGLDIFGDQSNLYSGSLEFVQNDVSIPGNNSLPVAVGRRFVAGSFKDAAQFGNWDLEIPHIHGIFATSWTTRMGTVADARCSSFGEPRTVTDAMRIASHRGTDYWHGSFIYVPGQGDQEILRRNTLNNNVPADGATYPLITTKLWAFTCLANLQNGPGEGFVAVAPNGTRYQFDWIASRYTAPLETDEWQLNRKEVWIMPTRITDRFGNWVSYEYDAANPWQLNSIKASDDRSIKLSWEAAPLTGSKRIVAVADGTRTWNYAYESSTNELQAVTLPDNSRWELGGATSLQQDVYSYNNTNSCDSTLESNGLPLTGSMTHPSGAVGTFTLTPTIHGRALVTYDCQHTTTNSNFLYYPKYFATNALTQKTISGPGISSPLTWRTVFPAPEPSLAECTGYCPTTKTVEVTAPDGSTTRHIFGTAFQTTEGQLQQTDVVENGSVLRSTTFTYVTEPAAGTFVKPMGYSAQGRGDGKLASELHPVAQKVIAQQGVSFTWRGDAFDSRGRNVLATKYSSFGPSKTEQISYVDKEIPWILNQVGTISVGGKTPVSSSYDSYGSLLGTSHFGRLDESFTYNADGTRATRRDGKNNQTDYLNYKRGIPQLVMYAEYFNGSRIRESAVISDIGLVKSVTDPSGSTTTYGYDAIGRLSSIAYPSDTDVAWNATNISFSQSSSAFYDLPAGHWRQHINTGNAATVNYFDALWRPVYSETWDAANISTTKRFTQYGYDFGGREVLESYPVRGYALLAGGKHYIYDALGRKTQTSTDSELGTLYAYDTYGSGFVATHTNERGYATNTSYQAFDEPTQDAITRVQMANGDSINIGRDLFNKATSINRSGNDQKSATRTYVYDANERLCKTIEPETGATVQDYDAANNVIWRASGNALPSSACDTASVAAARRVTFGYDALNRLQSTSYADASPAITRTFTADGLPLTIAAGGSVWSNGYDNRRHLISESLSYGGVAYNVGRSYDANGSLASLSYPIDNLTLAYSPNALGQPTQVGGYASAISYHPNGAIAGFTYGNGVVHALQQNVRGLPSQSSDTGVLNDSYSYDQNGNVAGIVDAATGASSRTMAYDDLDRLTSVAAPALWGSATYSYDALDNLTATTITGNVTPARSVTLNYPDPSTNRLMSASGSAGYNFAYAYDIQGNIIQRDGKQYSFDQGNRMTSAPGVASYAYDGLGHRISVVGTDGVNRIQVYSQGGQLLQAGPAGGGATRYVYLHNHVLAEVGPAGTQYQHTDALGSPVARTGAAGALVSQTRYEPYGKTAQGATPTLGFTGHVNDADTGLVYMQQRYYDPVAGRFLSIDPVTTDANTGGSFNRYVYANNSPYKYIDPDGRQAQGIEINCTGGCETYDSGNRAGGGSGQTAQRSGANTNTSGQNNPPDTSGTSGQGPNNRGSIAVGVAAAKLESQGFTILGREVDATIPGFPYTRRYDLIAENTYTGNVFGVEVKSSIYDTFKLNPRQVAFDVMAIKTGAMTELGIPIRSIMYRGVSFGSEPAAVWNTAKLVFALKAAGVGFDYTKSLLP